MNALVTTIGHLAGALSIPVSSDVPVNRPDAFTTVERGGGAKSKVDDRAELTVQVWSRDREALETLADAVCDALLSMPDSVDGVYRVTASKSYYPEQGAVTWPRYVLSCSVYCAA